MKKAYHSIRILLMLPIILLLGITSCKKDTDEGIPVITQVRTVYKSAVDSSVIYNVTYRDSSGTVVVDSVATTNGTPQVSKFDSSVVNGNLQNMYAIVGRNLSHPTQVLFNGAPAYFNSALASANSIIVTIPQNTPSGPDQDNVLTVVTTHGTATFQFIVNSPLPTVAVVSDYNFSAGSQITLTGVGFNSVSHVALSGVTDTCTIISKEDTVITLQFPATTANNAQLIFTYSSGSVTAPQVFVNMDNAYHIFTDDYGPGWADNSWSHPSGLSTAAAKTGTASFVATFPAGQWQIEGLSNWYPGVDYSADYKYLSFWVKGGTVDHTLNIQGDKTAGGYGQNDQNPLVIPKGVWTYFKIPIATLGLWATGTNFNQLGFFLKGQDGDVDETYYFDDILLLK